MDCTTKVVYYSSLQYKNTLIPSICALLAYFQYVLLEWDAMRIASKNKNTYDYDGWGSTGNKGSEALVVPTTTVNVDWLLWWLVVVGCSSNLLLFPG